MSKAKRRWTVSEVELAAKALAASELTSIGIQKIQTDPEYWTWAFSARERERYRKMARAALGAVKR